MSSRASLPPEDAVRAQCYINVRPTLRDREELLPGLRGCDGADMLPEVGIRNRFETHLDRPRSGVRLRIGDGHLDIHESSARAPKALDDVQRIAMRMAALVEPCLLRQTSRFGHEHIALPPADGVTEPRRVGIFWKR